LSVVEAKMASLLSSGTTHAKDYNQAARNIACMAFMTINSSASLQSLERISFTLVAPRQRINEGAFTEHLDQDTVRRAVATRCAGFDARSVEWFENDFTRFLSRCRISSIAWEDVVEGIAAEDAEFGSHLAEFYSACLRYNPIVPLRARPSRPSTATPAV
jgi:hypothetical protein